MAYEKKELYKTAVQIINKHKPHSIFQLISLMGISTDTFYRHFPDKSEESNDIKREMQLKNAEVVAATLNKTFQADTPSDRAMILKIYGGEEMRKKLSTNYNEITGEGGEKLSISVTVNDEKTGETLDKLRNGKTSKTD